MSDRVLPPIAKLTESVPLSPEASWMNNRIPSAVGTAPASTGTVDSSSTHVPAKDASVPRYSKSTSSVISRLQSPPGSRRTSDERMLSNFRFDSAFSQSSSNMPPHHRTLSLPVVNTNSASGSTTSSNPSSELHSNTTSPTSVLPPHTFAGAHGAPAPAPVSAPVPAPVPAHAPAPTSASTANVTMQPPSQLQPHSLPGYTDLHLFELVPRLNDLQDTASHLYYFTQQVKEMDAPPRLDALAALMERVQVAKDSLHYWYQQVSASQQQAQQQAQQLAQHQAQQHAQLSQQQYSNPAYQQQRAPQLTRHQSLANISVPYHQHRDRKSVSPTSPTDSHAHAPPAHHQARASLPNIKIDHHHTNAADVFGRSRRGAKKRSRHNLREEISCRQCGITETPEWRRGPDGARTLCNACGLYHAKLVKRKGEAEAAEIFRKRLDHRTSSVSQQKNTNQTTQSASMAAAAASLVSPKSP